MISSNINNNFTNIQKRIIKSKVEQYNGSTLLNTLYDSDEIIDFTIDRQGVNKFFGFGVCQKLNIHLLNRKSEVTYNTDDALKVYIKDVCFYPPFCITESHLEETTGKLSITAYDAIYPMAEHTVSELGAFSATTLEAVIQSCANLMGVAGIKYENVNTELLQSINLTETANYTGSETIRDLLDDIAEVLFSFYFINHENKLVFKALDTMLSYANNPHIRLTDYEAFEIGENRRLVRITKSTTLGNNESVEVGDITGTTQYIRDNPFLELRDDVIDILNAGLDNLGGATMRQYKLSWWGNPSYEIGDKLEIEDTNRERMNIYLFNDIITYNGGLLQKSSWKYEDTEDETEETPATIGEVIKNTYAKVDKLNNEISLVAGNTEANSTAISALQINAENIIASVSTLETNTNDALESVNEEISTVSNKVDLAMTSLEVSIAIKEEIEKGVDKVTTSTGFTFNQDGLTISKSDSQMETNIDEDGMTVYRNDEAVLVANNTGVQAENLHATTYLIIGNYSRLEDYDNRTGCFWIGG